MGDFFYYTLSKNEYAIGGFRTGNLIGSLIILFGWSYPFFLALVVFITFVMIEPLVIVSIKKDIYLDITFSPIAFINLYAFCFYFTSAALGIESISALLSYIARGWIQEIFIYYLLYFISHFFYNLLKFK